MNVLFITIDSLNRHFLNAYGNTTELAVKTPNLDAFAERSLIFDNHYAGSLPCMPARREFFTGVQEFLWRTWGPLEPFDQPVPRLARAANILSQLVTDHYHYFQHGSHGYYEDYQGWELIRGHEYDAWKTHPKDIAEDNLRQIVMGVEEARRPTYQNHAQYLRNVANFDKETDFFAPKVFSCAAEWLEQNVKEQDQWFLYIDSFEIHEPFHVPEPYSSMYTDENPKDPSLIYWPLYGSIHDGPSALTERQLAFVRAQYAGKLTMVDRWLGRVLERLDDFNLWDNTMVVITTDHGHYLGEHGWVGKPNCPIYNTLAHTPLFIWHPDKSKKGQRVQPLTSAVDLYATMLEALGISVPENGHSRSLMPLIKGATSHHRDWALYGYWGKGVNITDGRYTYLRAPDPSKGNSPLYNYSTMMMNTHSWFDPPRMHPNAQAGNYLPYADGPCWRYPLEAALGTGSQLSLADPSALANPGQSEHLLFDVQNDPDQKNNLAGVHHELEEPMVDLLRQALGSVRAPEEQLERLGL